jgi:RES domain-containing protein
MRVFRIERGKYLKTALTGIGASMTKGYRWNSLNTKLVYTAESRALATLEISVHLGLSEDLPTDRHYVEIDIPDTLTIQEVKIGDLPDDWNSYPPTTITQIIGDDFVFENEAVILKVPSSIVPQEFNYLINPNHPDVGKIKVITKIPMVFDPRFKVK